MGSQLDILYGAYPVTALGNWIALAPLFWLLCLLAFPVAKVLYAGLLELSEVTLWSDPYFWRILVFTYAQAFLSACLSAVWGTLGALLYSEQKFFWRRFFWHASMTCFSLPTILVVLSFFGFWGAQGLVNQALLLVGLPSVPTIIFGWSGILMAHVFFNSPLFLKAVGVALVDMDRTEERAALSLGASRWQCFWRLTVPKILPAIRSAFFLSFLYCATSFLIVLMMGGGPRFTTLEVAIFQALKVDFDLALAARLSLVQLLLSFAIYFSFLRRRGGLVEIPAASARSTLFPIYKFASPTLNRLVRVCFLIGFLLLVLGPLLSLVQSGITGFSQTQWRSWVIPGVTSLEIALAVGVLTTLFALALSYGERHSTARWQKLVIPYICSLPVSVSTVLLTFALLYCYPSLVSNLRGSPWVIVLVQTVAALPLVYRPLADGFLRIPENLYRASQSLGATPWQTLRRVEMPLLRNSLCLAVLMGVAFSLGEIGSVLVFLSEDISTIPLEIYRAFGQYRFPEAFSLGLILFSMMLSIYFVIGRLERGSVA